MAKGRRPSIKTAPFECALIDLINARQAIARLLSQPYDRQRLPAQMDLSRRLLMINNEIGKAIEDGDNATVIDKAAESLGGKKQGNEWRFEDKAKQREFNALLRKLSGELVVIELPVIHVHEIDGEQTSNGLKFVIDQCMAIGDRTALDFLIEYPDGAEAKDGEE